MKLRTHDLERIIVSQAGRINQLENFLGMEEESQRDLQNKYEKLEKNYQEACEAIDKQETRIDELGKLLVEATDEKQPEEVAINEA